MNSTPRLVLVLLAAFIGGAGVATLVVHRAPVAGIRDEPAQPTASAPQGPSNASSAQDAPPDNTQPGSKPISLAELKTETEDMQGLSQWGFAGMRRMADLGDRLLRSDPAALARQLAATPPQSAEDPTWALVMAAYAEKDPQGAWSFALALKPGPARQSAMLAAIATVATKDAILAMQMAEAMEDPDLKNHLRALALSELARKDPQKALQIADSSGSETGSSDMMQIFGAWALRDPEAAKAAAAGMTGRAREQAQRGLVNALLQSDPSAAWDYAQSLPPEGAAYRQQVIQTWAGSDPHAALRAAFSIKDGNTRANAVSGAVAAWSRTDFPDALQYAIAVEDTTLRSDIFRAMSSDAGQNRQQLLNAMVEHMPIGDNFQSALSNIFSGWARDNPAEAAAAVSQLPPGPALARATEQIASQWARAGASDEVLAWAQQLPQGEARTNALESLFSQLSTKDPQQALAALAGLSPEDRGNALRSLAAGWSKTNPQAVLQWAGTLTDKGERARIVNDALSQWANTAPDQAAAHAQRLPAEQRDDAMRAVVQRWAAKDAEAAADWLVRQPDGPAKDSSVAVLARKLAPEDPETALRWAESISNTGARDRQIEQIAADWMRQDPAAARPWVEQSRLSPKVRDRLLKL